MTATSITAADAVGCMAMPLPRAVQTGGTAIYTASATMTDDSVVLHRVDPNTSPPSGINPKALRSRLRMRGCMHPRMLRRMHRSIGSRGCMRPLLTSRACTGC